MSDERRHSPFRARRREALLALGGTGAWLLGVPARAETDAGAPGRLPACVLTPAQMEGPYFVD
jgi:hypothetical protein